MKRRASDVKVKGRLSRPTVCTIFNCSQVSKGRLPRPFPTLPTVLFDVDSKIRRDLFVFSTVRLPRLLQILLLQYLEFLRKYSWDIIDFTFKAGLEECVVPLKQDLDLPIRG